MDTFVQRRVSLLASGKQTKTAVSELLAAIDERFDSETGIITIAEDLAASLEASPAALGHFVSLLEHHKDARRLLGILLPVPDTDNTSPKREGLRRALATSQHSAAAIRAYAGILPSSDPLAGVYACYSLAALASKHKENARAAAGAGAIRKLVRVMENNPTEQEAEGFYNPLKLAACLAMDKIVEGSCNRARQASKAGAMKALCCVIAPNIDSTTVNCGVNALLSIVEGLDAITEDKAVLQLCFERLAHGLLRTDSHHKTKRTTAWLLGRYIGIDNMLSRMIAPVLAKAGAGRALVEISADKLEYEEPSAMGLLTCMLQRNPIDVAAEVAAEIVDAGVIDIAKRILREVPVTGDMAVIAAREPARLVLQHLLKVDMMVGGLNYGQLIGADGIQAIYAGVGQFDRMADAAEAAAAARLSACAACGRRSGSGKGGALQQCSACKKVVYCSRECQKGHWKVHKKKCEAA